MSVQIGPEYAVGTISTNGDHLAIQVGEMIFDKNNPNGVLFNKWLDDLGGPGFIQPSGKGAHIELHKEALGSKSKCP